MAPRIRVFWENFIFEVHQEFQYQIKCLYSEIYLKINNLSLINSFLKYLYLNI